MKKYINTIILVLLIVLSFSSNVYAYEPNFINIGKDNDDNVYLLDTNSIEQHDEYVSACYFMTPTTDKGKIKMYKICGTTKVVTMVILTYFTKNKKYMQTTEITAFDTKGNIILSDVVKFNKNKFIEINKDSFAEVLYDAVFYFYTNA